MSYRSAVLGPLLLLLTMHPSVAVEGDSTCPPSAEVARRLSDLMASVPDDVLQDRAVLRQETGGLHVDLLRDDGARIAERRVSSTGSCGDLAQAAAVIVATWEAQLRPQRLARPTLATGVATAQGSVAPAAPPQTFDFELGALGTLAGSQWQPGGTVAGSWAPPAHRLGIRAAFAAASTRTNAAAITSGATTSWTRGTFAVGPRFRLESALVRADGHAVALAGLVRLSTAGLTTNGSDTIAQLGLGGGIHLSPSWRSVAPWLGVDAQFWPAHDYLQVEDASKMPQIQGEVPRFELQISAGVAFGRF